MIRDHVILDHDIAEFEEENQGKDDDEHLKTQMIMLRTLQVPQYLDITSEECLTQLEIYQEASQDFLESTDIDKAIYYRWSNIWWQLFRYSSLYLIQAICLSNFLVQKT